jgi:hypothetical protein
MNEALRALVDAPQPSTYLHIENAQLKAQLGQYKGLLDQRFIGTVNDFVNGLMTLNQLAAGGDQQAVQLLKVLREGLEQSHEVASPLTVIRH